MGEQRGKELKKAYQWGAQFWWVTLNSLFGYGNFQTALLLLRLRFLQAMLQRFSNIVIYLVNTHICWLILNVTKNFTTSFLLYGMQKHLSACLESQI